MAKEKVYMASGEVHDIDLGDHNEAAARRCPHAKRQPIDDVLDRCIDCGETWGLPNDAARQGLRTRALSLGRQH